MSKVLDVIRSLWVSKAQNPVYAPLLYRHWHHDAHFRDNPTLLSQFLDVVYSCVERNSNSCASCYARVYDNNATELPDHPLQNLLDHPNPKMSGLELRKLTQLYLEILGTAYWRIVDGVLGVPSELWLLPSYAMTPVRDPNGEIISWKNGQVDLTLDEVLLFRFPNPSDPYGLGLSPLQACLRPSSLLKKDKDRQVETLDNAARQDAFVTPKGSDGMLSDERIEQLNTRMHEIFVAGGAKSISAFPIPLDVTTLGFSAQDSEQLARYMSNKTEILNAFGIPPSLFDSLRSRAELDAGLRQYGRQAIQPRIDIRDDVISHRLAPRFDPKIYVESDSPVIEDEDLRLQREQQDVTLGILTINEIRLSRGLLPVPWGDNKTPIRININTPAGGLNA